MMKCRSVRVRRKTKIKVVSVANTKGTAEQRHVAAATRSADELPLVLARDF